MNAIKTIQLNLRKRPPVSSNPVLKPITRRQNFRLVQTETNCRRHFKAHLK